MKTNIRIKFGERIVALPLEVQTLYYSLNSTLLKYKGVSNRQSTRCDSYRLGKRLIAKIAIGGKSLKIYLAYDPNSDFFIGKNYHKKNVSDKISYSEVPLLMHIKSNLALRKALSIIEIMMSEIK